MPDLPPKVAEGRSLTRSRPSAIWRFLPLANARGGVWDVANSPNAVEKLEIWERQFFRATNKRSKSGIGITATRQFVNHGHVQVNGQRVNIPSYRVKEGDVITVSEKAKQMALVLEAMQSAERDVPDYIEADHNKFTATYLRVPSLADVPFAVQMEPHLVVEFYAKN